MLTHNINVPIEGGYIDSTIYKPPDAKVIVLISHSLASGRFNLKNRQLTNQLADAGFATLLCDWSHLRMIQERHGDFNHLKMAQNLASIVRWLKSHRAFKDLSPALFGLETGASFSIIAASEMEDSIKSVVIQNGKLEAAEPYLAKVKTPTLIAVGDKDFHLLESSKSAYKKLVCPKRIVVLPGITPFFENPKKVARISRMAIDWIDKHSAPNSTSSARKSATFS